VVCKVKFLGNLQSFANNRLIFPYNRLIFQIPGKKEKTGWETGESKREKRKLKILKKVLAF